MINIDAGYGGLAQGKLSMSMSMSLSMSLNLNKHLASVAFIPASLHHLHEIFSCNIT